MEEKKLNRFIYLLYFLGVLGLFFVITCTPVSAASVKGNTDNYLVNYKMSSYNEIFSYWRSTDANGSGGSRSNDGWNLKPDTLPTNITFDTSSHRYNWPIKLFQQRGNNYFDYYYLNSYKIQPYFNSTSFNNSWCNLATNSNGCTLDIGFPVVWEVAIPNDTPNFDLSLQQSISYILNNYNKVNFSFYQYLDSSGNTGSISVPLNTKVIQTYQTEENGITYYGLNVYYTQKIYNFAYFSTIPTAPAGPTGNSFKFDNGGWYFNTSEYDSYTTYLLFHDNNLYWNISLDFNYFHWALSNSSNGGSNENTTGEDSSKDEILKQQEETNKKLEEIYAKINDTSPPDTSGLGGSAGWLPAGPVDSIINLPLTFFQGLNNAMSTSCSPVNVPLPFVNQSVQLPCVNTLFNQINGFSTWWNAMGLIAAAFILYKYLIHLYQWVDNTLTFRENNWQDWGGI